VDKTTLLLAGGVGAVWLLSRSPAQAALSPEAVQRAYAARLAAGDPQAGTATLTALLGLALKVGAKPLIAAVQKLLATGDEPTARAAVTQYLQAPSADTLEALAADLDVATAPWETPDFAFERLIFDDTLGLYRDPVTGWTGPWPGVEDVVISPPTLPVNGSAALATDLPPIPDPDAALQALQKVMAYTPDQLDAASKGLEAAAAGSVETGWTEAEIAAAQAMIGDGGTVPAEVAAGLDLAYGAGAEGVAYSASPELLLAGTEVTQAAPVAESLLTTLGPALRIAGIIGAAASIGFTIASDKPDLQKGVDSALDAVSIGALWIPVYGWAVAAGAQAVKFILGFTGLWGTDESHEVREAREAARYAGQFQVFTAQIQAETTWMGLFNRLGAWASGYVGGSSPAAVSVNVAGVREWIEPGQTDPTRDGPISAGYFGGQPNPYYQVATPAGGFLAILGNLGNLSVTVQAGIAEGMKAPMNAAIRGAIIVAMRGLITRGASDFPTLTPVGLWPDGSLRTAAGAIIAQVQPDGTARRPTMEIIGQLQRDGTVVMALEPGAVRALPLVLWADGTWRMGTVIVGQLQRDGTIRRSTGTILAQLRPDGTVGMFQG
jgi:hypothetical protein